MSSLYLVPDWNYRGHSDIDTTSRKSENTNTNSITCSSYRSSHRCLQCTPASCNLLHPAPGFWLLASVNCDHSLHCTADTDFWMVIQYSILYTVSVYTLIYITMLSLLVTSGLKRPCTYSETGLTIQDYYSSQVCVFTDLLNKVYTTVWFGQGHSVH